MTIEATAAIAYEPEGQLILKNIVLDKLQPEEILIDIEACGICHTDSKFQKVLPLPAVFGHEGVGIVCEIGTAVKNIKRGDRVILSYPFCTHCTHCREAEYHKCENIPALKFAGKRIDGSKTISLDGEKITSSFFQQSSFATKAIVLEQAVVKIDSDLPSELLAALPCGIQTGAGAVLNTFNISANDRLLIIGAGTVGLSAVMAAKLCSAYPIICIDINKERLELAKELGATHAFDAKSKTLIEDVSQVCEKGVNFVVESSATTAGLKTAISCIGQGGQIGILSYPNNGDEFPFSTKQLFQKVGSIVSIIQGSSIPKLFLPKLIALHERGVFPFEKLVSHYDFLDINMAIKDMHGGKVIKPVLKM